MRRVGIGASVLESSGESPLWCLQQERSCFLSTYSHTVGLGPAAPLQVSMFSTAGLPRLFDSTVALNLGERFYASRLVANWLALLTHSRTVLGF